MSWTLQSRSALLPPPLLSTSRSWVQQDRHQQDQPDQREEDGAAERRRAEELRVRAQG